MHACASPEVVYSGEFALLKNTEKGTFPSAFFLHVPKLMIHFQVIYFSQLIIIPELLPQIRLSFQKFVFSSSFYGDSSLTQTQVQQIIEMNFPHIEVVAVSFDDPVFATCKERMKVIFLLCTSLFPFFVLSDQKHVDSPSKTR